MRCIRFKANCYVGSGINIINNSGAINPDNPEYIALNNFITNPVNEYEEYAHQIIRNLMDDYSNFGMGFLEIVVNNDHKISEIYNFPAYQARVYFNSNIKAGPFSDKVLILQLVNSLSARAFPLFTEKSLQTAGSYIFWLKNYNPFNRFYGFPEWYSNTPKFILDKMIDEYNIRMFKNDLLISVAVIVEGGELGEGGLNEISEFLSKNYTSVQNANRAIYLHSDSPEVKIRIEKIQKDGREASFQITQNNCRDAATVAHGVIASLLGIATPGKLGTNQENYDLFRVFNSTVIKPEQIILQNKLNNLFRIGLGIVDHKIEIAELTFERLTESVQFATQLNQAGIIDKHEARPSLGYDPKKDSSIENDINHLSKQVKLLKSKLE